MDLENLISSALCNPADHRGYFVGRLLAEKYPDRGIIEGDSSLFLIDEFVEAGKCLAVGHESVHNQVRTSYDGPGEQQQDRFRNALLSLIWNNRSIEVLLIVWIEGYCANTNYWIIAETEEVARSFHQAVCDWSASVRDEILIFDDGYWTKSKELFQAIRKTSFDNLVLSGRTKDEIRGEIRRFLESRSLYERHGVPWKRGILLIGLPGNGKTHAVKAMVNEAGLPCIYVKSFGGDDADQENIGLVFARSRRTAPCILVLEDIDSLVDEKNRSLFLNEMDGFEANTGLIVIATTNHPGRLDPAILDRPSRFDRKYYFDLPHRDERSSYIDIWNSSIEPTMRLSQHARCEVATLTEGFSFAYLKELFLASVMQWAASGMCAGRMDSVVLDQLSGLREQMSRKNSGEG